MKKQDVVLTFKVMCGVLGLVTIGLLLMSLMLYIMTWVGYWGLKYLPWPS